MSDCSICSPICVFPLEDGKQVLMSVGNLIIIQFVTQNICSNYSQLGKKNQHIILAVIATMFIHSFPPCKSVILKYDLCCQHFCVFQQNWFPQHNWGIQEMNGKAEERKVKKGLARFNVDGIFCCQQWLKLSLSTVCHHKFPPTHHFCCCCLFSCSFRWDQQGNNALPDCHSQPAPDLCRK